MAARPPDRAPVSTYRLQLNHDFTLYDAARVVPYLAELGITDLYCSPILTAAPGSEHGYDVCDYAHVSPELGGEDALRVLDEALKQHGMGLVLDFVPNHMGIHESANLWWRDVLENGPSSPYARFFDIDWNPVKRELEDRVLLPILGDQYGAVLDRGELQISLDSGSFHLHYHEHDLPLNPRQWTTLLQHNLDEISSRLPADDPAFTEFQSVLFHLEHLPAYQETSADAIEQRQREKEVAKRRLAALIESSPAIREHVSRNIREFNGTPGQPESFRLLHALLEEQPYRLSYWKTATHEINYRRFFDVNGLAGVRMEDPDVFRRAHELILRLIRDGVVTGLRLDHVDGLFDPKRYFEDLHAAVGPDRHLYLVVEKILSKDENLRPDWAVHGTTGYEFLNDLNGIFIDQRREREFRRFYHSLHGARSFGDVVYQSKKLIIETAMASELHVLAHEANRISESDPHTRDFTLLSLQDALTEVVACFPVYRCYVNADGWDAFDRHNVDRAVRQALARNPAAEPSIFEFLRRLLLPSRQPGRTDPDWARALVFAMKVQQYTSPVEAKGVEDTAFYRYNPLLPLNEVGGHPQRFGNAPENFHASNSRRRQDTPLSMSATSTHDTKCGEDGRARLNVLSEIQPRWREQVRAWNRINSSARTRIGETTAPDRLDEYLYYQALLAAWPPGQTAPAPEFVQRIAQHMNKATKEKKVHTSWINPSPVYDAAIARFVEQTLAGTRMEPFLARFLPFQRRIAELGMLNSLSQTVLKLISPGVSDIYQGSESWNLNLVDPDNRRPVDFSALHHELAHPAPAQELLARWENGHVKQFVTAAGLRLRRAHPDLFLSGAYAGAETGGIRSVHVVACGRFAAGKSVVAVVPRLVATLSGFEGGLPLGSAIWGDTYVKLPKGAEAAEFVDLFTGVKVNPCGDGTLPVETVLREFPVSLLVSNDVKNGKEAK